MSATTDLELKVSAKMEAAGVGKPTIQSFLAALRQVAAGERGMVSEQEIDPVGDLPRLGTMPSAEAADAKRLRELAVVKLNGGLGTSMGLERAKSLILVKGADSFLDFIARQILHLRGGKAEPAFYLMNSFSTREDTLSALARHPELMEAGTVDFLQNKVPKLDATALDPVIWRENTELEWCPPGHGDIYPSLASSGLLDRLLERGIRFLFVSNADNLGATVDLRLLRFFDQADLSFLMEVAERTPADRKGGHLARRRSSGRLLLRESAQAPKEEQESFQDILRHRFFNTNNLWIRLDRLKQEIEANGGTLPLPLITNVKTVDPKQPASPRVLQLESAMGAAIECFERSGAVVVGRGRFAPVKTTADLLGVRSDAYRVTEDHRLVLDERREGRPPLVELDPAHYRVLRQFDEHFSEGAPSLIDCTSLRVEGAVRFSAGVVCRGRVAFCNSQRAPVTVAPGVYDDSVQTW
jgi:UDP-N-acetylglucosamine pyrophosphorylase